MKCFINIKHLERFLELMKLRYGISEFPLSGEYMSALYVLSSELLYERVKKYVSRAYIDFEELRIHTKLSSSMSTMVNCSESLYSYNINVDLLDIVSLDRDNFNIIINSVFIRRDPKILLEEINSYMCKKRYQDFSNERLRDKNKRIINPLKALDIEIKDRSFDTAKQSSLSNLLVKSVENYVNEDTFENKEKEGVQ